MTEVALGVRSHPSIHPRTDRSCSATAAASSSGGPGSIPHIRRAAAGSVTATAGIDPVPPGRIRGEHDQLADHVQRQSPTRRPAQRVEHSAGVDPAGAVDAGALDQQLRSRLGLHTQRRQPRQGCRPGSARRCVRHERGDQLFPGTLRPRRNGAHQAILAAGGRAATGHCHRPTGVLTPRGGTSPGRASGSPVPAAGPLTQCGKNHQNRCPRGDCTLTTRLKLGG